MIIFYTFQSIHFIHFESFIHLPVIFLYRTTNRSQIILSISKMGNKMSVPKVVALAIGASLTAMCLHQSTKISHTNVVPTSVAESNSMTESITEKITKVSKAISPSTPPVRLAPGRYRCKKRILVKYIFTWKYGENRTQTGEKYVTTACEVGQEYDIKGRGREIFIEPSGRNAGPVNARYVVINGGYTTGWYRLDDDLDEKDYFEAV